MAATIIDWWSRVSVKSKPLPKGNRMKKPNQNPSVKSSVPGSSHWLRPLGLQYGRCLPDSAELMCCRRDSATGEALTNGAITPKSARPTLIRRGLNALELSEGQLKASKSSEVRTVSLAWAIARSTTMSQSWIADRLSMRSAANVTQKVRRFERELGRQTDSRIKCWIKTVKN